MGYEIHPETPQGGLSLSSHISRTGIYEMLNKLNTMGEPYGIEFNEIDFLPNSKIAIQSSEFARENNKFDQFHEGLFSSYFTYGENIGQIDVIMELAQEVGLNVNGLINTLNEKRYVAILDHVREEAMRCGVTGAPTFIIEEKDRIVGAQPIEIFREILKRY